MTSTKLRMKFTYLVGKTLKKKNFEKPRNCCAMWLNQRQLEDISLWINAMGQNKPK